MTDRRWQRCEIIRRDKRPNHLWEIEQATWSRSLGWNKELEEQLEDLAEKLGSRPDLDLAGRLFNPPVSHEQMPKVDDEHNVFRIKVDGVVVRYVANHRSIQITVEGILPASCVQILTTDLCGKMAELENVPFETTEL